jgi:hypothetical protein
MSVEKHEESRIGGEPINLYRFQHGPRDNDFYGYTDFERDLISDNVLYKAIPLQRGAVNSSGTLDRTALEIRMPGNLPLPRLFTGFPPSNVVNLVILQGHVDDVDVQFLPIWSGRVLACAHQGTEATLTCEPISTSMRRVGLRRHYQYMCPHVLYGDQCRASKTAATITVTVDIASGRRIIIGGVISHRARYIGGLAEWTAPDGRRHIRSIAEFDVDTANDRTGVTLSGPSDGLLPGRQVSLSYGCSHKTQACIEWHSNIRNFGGQPFIPLKNPVGSTHPFS